MARISAFAGSRAWTHEPETGAMNSSLANAINALPPVTLPAWNFSEIPVSHPRWTNACPEYRRNLSIDRRGFLQAGMAGMAGLSLPQLLRHQARAAQALRPVDRTKSVIILWMRGGPSQHDMWDPKPDAPAEIRG